MRIPINKYYFFTFFLFVFSIIQSQNLEKLGKKDMVKINGGLNFNSIFLQTNNPLSIRDPFSWYLNGNLNINVLDWSIPFTYSYSNQHGTYTQPFNQYGLTPTYKWIKIHAGWSNMNFSPYTLSGHPFLGGGIELSPKNWKMSILYGQFKKAIEWNNSNNSSTEMSFKRMGLGALIGYEKKGYGLNFIWFEAKDKKNSLQYIPETSQIQPQENTVISFNGKAPINKSFTLNAEYALSGHTRNSFAEEINSEISKNKLPILFKQKTTSQFFDAFKTSINYASKFFNCGLNYEQISPGYKTLGIFFINNDMRNFTISPQIRLLKSKLNISLNMGMQQNNLKNEKLSTMKRWIGSSSLTYQINSHWNTSFNYSNFTSFTRVRPNTDPFYQPSPTDTMQFYQVSQNANALINYSWGNNKVKNALMTSGSYQVSQQQSGSTEVPATHVLNYNIGYVKNLVSSKTTININFNVNQASSLKNINSYYGPGITIGKAIFQNKVNLNFASIYNLAVYNHQNNGSVLNERISLTASPKIKNTKFGKPTIALSASYVKRLNEKINSNQLQEFTGNIILGYSF